MQQAIRFQARSFSKNIYYPGDYRHSSVQRRATLTSKEINRKKFGLPKKVKPIPLNQIVITRIHSKSHTYQCHSPEPIRLHYKNMWLYWSKKLNRNGVSVSYINKKTLHRFL